MLYQLSYPAKLHNSAIFQCSYSCELQTKYTKGNKCKIYIEIMKYAIYAKSAQLNSVFCLDFEFFHHFPPTILLTTDSNKVKIKSEKVFRLI